MIYVWGGILAAFIALGAWGHFHGEGRYKDGKNDCNNEWVAKGAAEKAEMEAKQKGAQEQSAADAKAVGAVVRQLSSKIDAGRAAAAQPVKVVRVFPPGCKVAPEIVAEVNK